MNHLSKTNKEQLNYDASAPMPAFCASPPCGNQALLRCLDAEQPLQRYHQVNTPGGAQLVSDDKSITTYAGNTHVFATTPAKLTAAAAAILAQNPAGIQLVQAAGAALTPPAGQVLVTASYNGGQQDEMNATSDCGEFAQLLMGNQNIHGKYQSMGAAKDTRTSPEGNTGTYLEDVLNNVSTVLLQHANYVLIDTVLKESVSLLSYLIAALRSYQWSMSINKNNIIIESPSAVTYLDAVAHPDLDQQEARQILDESIFARKLIWNMFKKRYPNNLPKEFLLAALHESPTLSQEFSVNAFASPHVGEGFVSITAGENLLPPEQTWDYHWSGVVMESTDGKDYIVIENFAHLIPDPQNLYEYIPAVNNEWRFKMHGTRNAAQSFHTKHFETDQHGSTPLTLSVSG